MFNQRCESFIIKRRIDRLIYELKLSAHWRIHSIISITQLKSCFNQSNSYNRFRLNYFVFVEIEKNIDDWKFYIVERIMNKRFRKFERITVTQYMIKWLNYESKFNEWRSLFYLNNCMKLVEKYEAKKKHINENLSNISSFSTSASALFTSTTFISISTKSMTESIRRERDRLNTKNNTQSVTKSIKKKRDRFKKKTKS